jgi:hypothetical protein
MIIPVTLRMFPKNFNKLGIIEYNGPNVPEMYIRVCILRLLRSNCLHYLLRLQLKNLLHALAMVSNCPCLE